MERKSGRGGGGPRGQAGPGAEKIAVRKKAEKLAASAGIPRSWALQVAQGKATLNDVLTRLARQDRIEQLERRHGLDRSTAAQVADGSQDLDQVLLRNRLAGHLEEHGGRSIFEEARESGRALVLHLHGLRTVTASIGEVDAYEIDLVSADGQERVHKLQVKMVHDARFAAKVREASEGRAAAEPRARPQDRFHTSDKRLYAWLDSKARLRFRTLEGDLVEGRLAWIARWELGLSQADGEVVLMRHALAGVEEL